MIHHCNGRYTPYAGSGFFMVTQLNHYFSRAVVRTFVAMGVKKPMLVELTLHKFPKEMKYSSLLSVSMLWSSMLWSSVLCDRLLSLSNTSQPTNERFI